MPHGEVQRILAAWVFDAEGLHVGDVFDPELVGPVRQDQSVIGVVKREIWRQGRSSWLEEVVHLGRGILGIHQAQHIDAGSVLDDLWRFEIIDVGDPIEVEPGLR